MNDDLLFDIDEDEIGAPERTNFLVVGPVCTTPEELNEREAIYRREGRPPIIFVDDDGSLDNAAEMARAMGLSDSLPTLADAEQFCAAWQAAGKAPTSW